MKYESDVLRLCVVPRVRREVWFGLDLALKAGQRETRGCHRKRFYAEASGAWLFFYPSVNPQRKNHIRTCLPSCSANPRKIRSTKNLGPHHCDFSACNHKDKIFPIDSSDPSTRTQAKLQRAFAENLVRCISSNVKGRTRDHDCSQTSEIGGDEIEPDQFKFRLKPLGPSLEYLGLRCSEQEYV